MIFFEERITEKLLQEFKQWVASQWSRSTAEAYECRLKAHCFGMKANYLNDVKNIRELKLELEGKGLRPYTVALQFCAIKSFLLFMQETRGWKIIDTKSLKYHYQRNSKVEYLTPEQIAQIRSLPIVGNASLRHRALFEHLLYTGCRISEALSIKRQDINWETGEVEVLGKGGKYRVVMLGESAEWIKKMLAASNDDNPALFVTQKGYVWHRVTAGEAIRQLGKKAELPFILHPHTLRKTFCTYLIWSGTDPGTVQGMMGHSDIKTTFMHYVALDKARMVTAHKTLDKLFAFNPNTQVEYNKTFVGI